LRLQGKKFQKGSQTKEKVSTSKNKTALLRGWARRENASFGEREARRFQADHGGSCLEREKESNGVNGKKSKGINNFSGDALNDH